MQLILSDIRKSLNKAYLKARPTRSQIEAFKRNIISLIDNSNESESEEFHKNLLSEFLKNTYYSPGHFINTKGRADLVIHTGKNAASPVGVIFETKKPGAGAEMPSAKDLNVKAFHELILYYLRERHEHKNVNIRHLVITNVYEWFIFSSNDFEKIFAANKSLEKKFEEFKENRLSDRTTEFFYNEVAAALINESDEEITATHFDIRDFEETIRNPEKADDKKLIALFKIFSPEHLLKLSFSNDSNSLDRSFYSELLHIIGLEETKEGGKKVIGRKKEGKRNNGSFIENSINILKYEDCLAALQKRSDYGTSSEEQLYNISLELAITWINRILFLKLLESQLVKYNNGDRSFRFLNSETIGDFDELNRLFFQVLAVKEAERSQAVQKKYTNVPFLNSSLFEPTPLEHQTIRINSLEDSLNLGVPGNSVLKDKTGKKITGELTTLDYLFRFLDSYDFSGEGSEDIQEENKTLINASVLGLIFEKINGYKDGSFFTPGFITMYMCHETITHAVVQKFNEAKGWGCETINSVYNKITDIEEANRLVNSLKICDPAVGSGHFLVSALNEIIAIKSELGILSDKEGKRLKDYSIEVINDELVITGPEGEFFEYNPKNKESQRVQETLFREKQTIIENCLFGVDINPNSVKICRLRLWIELLKNAYYREERRQASGDGRQETRHLETLPNIDINIKCGNSLISRYPLDADIGSALKSARWNVDNYREAVMTYRNAPTKEVKRKMEELIEKIKSQFETEVALNDKRLMKLNKMKGELDTLTGQGVLFDKSKKEKDEWNRKVKKASDEMQRLETEIAEIKSNKIYEDAFEWRFEFPEVLDDNGNFIGFDVVIGNPPYIRQEEIKVQKEFLVDNYIVFKSTSDIYVFFVSRGFELLKVSGHFCYIMPNKWMKTEYGKPLRQLLLHFQLQSIIDFGDLQVFEEATTYPCILNASRNAPGKILKALTLSNLDFENSLASQFKKSSINLLISDLTSGTWIIKNSHDQDLLKRLKINSITLSDYVDNKSYRGILTGLTEAFVINYDQKESLIREDRRSMELIKPLLLGRDIKPYAYPQIKNWLITVPKGFTIKKNLLKTNPNHIKEPPPRYGDMPVDVAWNWFSSTYPSIAKHLSQFKDKAQKRLDKGDFWWELRACDYYAEFEKTKIMYQKFQVRPCFIYDEEKLYCNDSMWIIPTENRPLLGILNSKMGWWLISKYCTAIQNGYQLIWKYLGQIPIPEIESKIDDKLSQKVNMVLQAKKSNPSAETTTLESEIDRLVYELYGLTEEEIRIVEGETA